MVDLNELREMLRTGTMELPTQALSPGETKARASHIAKTTFPLSLNNLSMAFTLRVEPRRVCISASWETHSLATLEAKRAAKTDWPEEKEWVNVFGSGTDLLSNMVLLFNRYPYLRRNIQYAHASMLLWNMGASIGNHAYHLERGHHGLLSAPELISLRKGKVWAIPDFELREFKDGPHQTAAEAQNDHAHIVDAISVLAEWYRTKPKLSAKEDGRRERSRTPKGRAFKRFRAE